MSLPRPSRGRLFSFAAAVLMNASAPCLVEAAAHVPGSDDVVLAELSTGTRYADVAARRLARGRIDVAVPLAQFYIQQSRLTGDLRFLGYAEAVLAPWVAQHPTNPDALVLQATLQQSRHEFAASLVTLDRVLAARPNDAQGLLIRATVLRVLGRYSEAGIACEQFSRRVDARLAALCVQSLRGLSGHLESAYAVLTQVSSQGWLNSEKSWLYSELGEMAVRLGRNQEAIHWFQKDLKLVPTDFYTRAAYADLLLQQGQPAEVLSLLQGQDSFEPLLLRIAIAQRQLHDPGLKLSSARLRTAFAAELQRGEAVHRREQARFLLEVEDQPRQSLDAARENWTVQHEPDDVLALIRAASSAGEPAAASAALDFVRTQQLSDVRVSALTTAMALR